MDSHGVTRSVLDERGGLTVIFAIYITGLFMLITLLIDGASVISAKRSMQAALDIAALTGAKLLVEESMSDDSIKSGVDSSFLGNLKFSRRDLACASAELDYDKGTGNFAASIICKYSPMLGGTIAPETIDVKVSSKTFISIRKLDVAMVLDVSGSMGSDGKLEAMKTAAKSAATTMINAGRSGDIRVSYVAYANAVNIVNYGSYARGESETVEALPSSGISVNCVSERVGDGAWDDRPPGAGAYFPKGDFICPIFGLFPLSSDLTSFSTAVDSLMASGATAGHLGVAWAWYLLSPKWSDVWPEASKPLPYGAANTIKVMILMTDGKFNKSTHEPYGDSSTQAKKLCGKMRDQGIIIFSVAFQAPAAGQETLKDCAGDESYFFSASTNAELVDAYEDISRTLVELRIVE